MGDPKTEAILDELLDGPSEDPEWVVITIPGEPVAWARTGGRGKIRYTKPKQRTGKGVLMMYFEEAMEGRDPFDGPLQMDVICVFPNRKKPRKRVPRPRRWHTKKKDRDNLLKLIQDAGNGILYHDDSQVVAGDVVKLIGAQGEAPHTRIVLQVLDPYEDMGCPYG